MTGTAMIAQHTPEEQRLYDAMRCMAADLGTCLCTVSRVVLFRELSMGTDFESFCAILTSLEEKRSIRRLKIAGSTGQGTIITYREDTEVYLVRTATDIMTGSITPEVIIDCLRVFPTPLLLTA